MPKVKGHLPLISLLEWEEMVSFPEDGEAQKEKRTKTADIC